MKIAVISDVHLGDDDTTMVDDGRITDTYRAFRDAVAEFTGGKHLDYLVLAGDILDFSVNSFAGACRAARPFFRAVARDGLAEQVVYIPGNHDKYVWDAVEWETSIVMRMTDHDYPREFRRTQPAVLRYPGRRIHLPGVGFVEGTRRYGGLFVEGLFSEGDSRPIIVAYPNLYIATEEAVYVVTHGHMLDLAWILVSELLGDEEELARPFGLKELEEYNHPLTAMICTAVGQAGAASRIFYRIQQEAKRGETGTLENVLKHAGPRLERMIELSRLLEPLDNLLIYVLQQGGPYVARHAGGARYNEAILKSDAVKVRFRAFWDASVRQAQADELGLAAPTRMIFGHTHVPFGAGNPMPAPDDLDGPEVIYNTGGWLGDLKEAPEVVFFDDDGALSSVSII